MLPEPVLTVLAIIGGIAALGGPITYALMEHGRRLNKHDDERTIVTDHKERTIEKLSRTEEKLRALAERFQQVELIRNDEFTRLSKKIDDEIHAQARTREIHGNMIEVAMGKIDIRLVDLTKTTVGLAERLSTLEAEVGFMKRIKVVAQEKADG